MATVASLAAQVGGKVVGDDSVEIDDLAPLDQAGPGQISFFANRKYLAQFLATSAGAVLVNEPIDDAPCPQIVCDNAYLAMAQLATRLHPPPTYEPGVHPAAFVHQQAELHPSASVCAGAVVEQNAKIGARSVIGANAYVGRAAQLGEDVLMHPGSKVLDRCQLNNRVILQPGAVIGSDGFGYAPDAQGRRHKIPQVGIVVLEEDVEIGANTTVDRATFGQTRIGRGTKLDNLVQIGHNVVLGNDCIVVSQSGIAGSAKAGNRLIMGAQTGMIGHIEIPDDVTVGARGGLAQAVDAPGVYSGVPAMPHRQWLKMVIAQQSLPEMRRQLRAQQKQIDTLEAKVEE